MYQYPCIVTSSVQLIPGQNPDVSDFPFSFLHSAIPDTAINRDFHLDFDADIDADADADPFESYNDPFEDNFEMYSDDLPLAAGAVDSYLGSVKENINSELKDNALPLYYQRGSFWVYPPDPYFGLCNAVKNKDGLEPTCLYKPKVFVWLPHLLDRQSILTCQNHECSYYKKTSHPLTFKAWNENPVAHRVVDIKDNYYILTQRMQCHKIPAAAQLNVEEQCIYMIQ